MAKIALLKLCMLTCITLPSIADKLDNMCSNKTMVYLRQEPGLNANAPSFTRAVEAHVQWIFPSNSGEVETLANLLPGLYEDVYDQIHVGWTTFLRLSTVVSHETFLSSVQVEHLFQQHSGADAVHIAPNFALQSLSTVTLVSSKLSCTEMWPQVIGLQNVRIFVQSEDAWALIQVFQSDCSSNLTVTHPTVACEQNRFDFSRVTSAKLTTTQETCTRSVFNATVQTSYVRNAWSLNCTMVRSQGLCLCLNIVSGLYYGVMFEFQRAKVSFVCYASKSLIQRIVCQLYCGVIMRFVFMFEYSLWILLWCDV